MLHVGPDAIPWQRVVQALLGLGALVACQSVSGLNDLKVEQQQGVGGSVATGGGGNLSGSDAALGGSGGGGTDSGGAEVGGNGGSAEVCGDAIDNDNDGKTDCEDSECASASQCTTCTAGAYLGKCELLTSGEAGCDQCMHTQCCNEIVDCYSDAECSGLVECLIPCTGDLNNCIAKTCPFCATVAAVDKFNAYQSCLTTHCATECQ